MRVGLVPTVSAPVRKDTTGSVEAWAWLLSRELSRLGHEVTLFACGGSEADADIVTTLPGPYGAAGSLDDWQLCEWVNLCRAVGMSDRFDVIHSQAYLWGIPLQPLSRVPMVHTMHIAPDANAARLWASMPDACVTAISHHQWAGQAALRPAAVIHHGVDVAQFTFREQPDDYLLYLGRFTSGKGPLLAIETAQALGVKLVMAGPENPYFRDRVRPLIDGRLVEYAGYVRGDARDALLGGARALLYPIRYPEAFGLVLLEAMLCGTPVAALRFGAVTEILEEAISGFTADTDAEFAELVPRCFALDRRRIRERALQRFSAERMAQDYSRVYAQLSGRG